MEAQLKLDEQLIQEIKLTPVNEQPAKMAKREEWLVATLSDAVYARDELLRMSDREALHTAARALSGRRMVEIGKELADYRRRLGDSMPLFARALEMMQVIDALLVQLPDSTVFHQGINETSVGTFIRHRQINIIDLRFEHIIASAELSLNPLKARGLSRWHKAINQLSGKRLRAAAAAHADVLTSELSPEDRAEVLQEAWHQYSMAIYRASRQLSRAGRW